MFHEFYYYLRSLKLNVSITEFLAFSEAVARGMVNSAEEFYYIARATMIKDEKHFDLFDQAFMHFYKDAEPPKTISDEILKWLNKPFDHLNLEPWERELLEKYDLETLRRELEKRLQEQKEEHNGGDYWIGTRGRSPFGHSGVNPYGIRIGGYGGLGMAVKIAEQRLFRNYRSDIILDTRQIQIALRKLRKLSRIGQAEELDLPASIKATCKNLGDIELKFVPRKKNNVKLILLMDVGGSMNPFAGMVSALFSAANNMQHFKDFKYYYFHNCVYENLYTDIERQDAIPTADVLRQYDNDYRVIFVGDAAMAPYELLDAGGRIYYYDPFNETPGIVWLKRIREKFPKSVWLNPEIVDRYVATTRGIIAQIFPMFDLTLDGLEEAIEALL